MRRKLMLGAGMLVAVLLSAGGLQGVYGGRNFNTEAKAVHGSYPISQKQLVRPAVATRIGEFCLTVYTPYCDGGVWGYRTATGEKSRHLATCAVDPSVIPLGSTLVIDGLGEVKAIDTGSAVVGRKIDLFYDGTVEEAYRWIESFGTQKEITLVSGAVE